MNGAKLENLTAKGYVRGVGVFLGVVLRVLAVIIGVAVAAPWAAFADDVTLSTKQRMKLFENQTRILDTRLSEQYAHSARLQPDRTVPVPGFQGTDSPYLAAAQAAARRHNIPEDLFLRLVSQESGWNPRAVSPKGALGLAQLMPGTASALGVNPRDPLQNLEGGARYLRTQFETFGQWDLALAAYNAGPGAVETHRGIPPFDETRSYVRAILGR